MFSSALLASQLGERMRQWPAPRVRNVTAGPKASSELQANIFFFLFVNYKRFCIGKVERS